MYKVIVLDLDGTTLNSHKIITPYTEKVIKKLKNKVKVILASARGYYRIKDYLKQLELVDESEYTVAFNGAMILKNNGKILKKDFIDKNNIYKLNKIIDNTNAKWWFYYENGRIQKKHFSENFLEENKIYKIIGIDSKENILKLKKTITPEMYELFEITSSEPDRIEFLKKGSTKYNAINDILLNLNLNYKDVLAIGDGENDLELLKHVGCSVAPVNAHESVKKIVDFITSSNDEDGVGKILEQIFNENKLEKIQINNDKYTLYSPDSLKFLTDNINNILNKTLEDYCKLFNISNFRKIQINYFDDITKFREYIYSLRKENKTLPEYAKGTYDKGMINAYISPSIKNNPNLYKRKLYMASHELFHIMYQEIILTKNNYKRVIWFDEGSAEYFSKEFEELKNTDVFQVWFKQLLNDTKVLPKLNELKHGFNFETENYSGYKLSYLAIKYLFETLGFNKFQELMKDIPSIEKYGEYVLEEAIKYYKKEGEF